MLQGGQKRGKKGINCAENTHVHRQGAGVIDVDPVLSGVLFIPLNDILLKHALWQTPALCRLLCKQDSSGRNLPHNRAGTEGRA